MAFPTNLTNAVDGVTDVLAAHLNNLEAKVGIDGSAVTTSLDYLLKNSASVNPGHKHTISALSSLAANSLVGNNTGAPATPLALSAAQVKTLLAIAQADVSGLTTASSPTFAALTAASLTSTGALGLNAGGSNQNVTITPSGTGYTQLSGNVGIGITPVNILTVRKSGSNPVAGWVTSGNPLFVGYGETTIGNADFMLAMAADAAARAVFLGRRSRGTLAAPTVVANNDYLMSFLCSGYDGSAFQNSAAIDFYVDGTPSSGNVPARISFVTGSNGSNRTERLLIKNDGSIQLKPATSCSLTFDSTGSLISYPDNSSAFPGLATLKINNNNVTAFGNLSSLAFCLYSSPVPICGIAGVYDNWNATNSGGGVLAFYTKDAATEANPSEKMRLTKNGRLGIYNTAPGGLLEVGSSTYSTNIDAYITARGANSLQTQLVFRVLNSGGSNAGGAIGSSGGGLFLSGTTGISSHLTINSSGQIGIGTSSPNAAALVHLSSTTMGFLPPVMTTTQKNAISSPPAGLVVYDSTLNKLCLYTGSAWQTVTSA